jgi:hypothetical protein
MPIGVYKSENRGRYFVIDPLPYLVGDLYRHVAAPSFSRIERNDAHRAFILPFEDIADHRGAARRIFVRHAPSPAERAEVVQHNIGVVIGYEARHERNSAQIRSPKIAPKSISGPFTFPSSRRLLRNVCQSAIACDTAQAKPPPIIADRSSGLTPPVQTSSLPLESGGFSFLFWQAGLAADPLFINVLVRRRRLNLPRKSGGPPLFAPSLNVERYIAHDPNSGFAVLPWCYGLNADDVRKVPTTPQGNQHRR